MIIMEGYLIVDIRFSFYRMLFLYYRLNCILRCIYYIIILILYVLGIYRPQFSLFKNCATQLQFWEILPLL